MVLMGTYFFHSVHDPFYFVYMKSMNTAQDSCDALHGISLFNSFQFAIIHADMLFLRKQLHFYQLRVMNISNIISFSHLIMIL